MSELPQMKFNGLKDWFSDDREVDQPSKDRFGHDVIAQRIAKRLRNSSGTGEAPTIAVVGPLGSGKSTICELARYHLRDCTEVELVRISLWPFDSAEAAARGILDRLVEGLNLHVNTLGLSGLADQYINTVEKVGGRWGGIARLLRGPRQPEEILKRISSVTRAINVRLVLWIDDLERFCQKGARLGEDVSADGDGTGAIHALLHLLDSCDRVSVIVADTSLETRLDLDKIARFVERVPRLNPDHVCGVINVVRKQYLNGFPKKIIDPVKPEVRAKFLQSPTVSRQVARITRGLTTQRMSLEDALALVLATPRAFKSVLRLVHEVWTELAGEIDLDDVLLASAIRVAQPDLFALIDRHIDAFRIGFSWRRNLDEQDRCQHPAYLEIEKVIERAGNGQLQEAIRVLLQSVFPGYPEKKGNIGYYEEQAFIQPQGLRVDRHVDYWLRYLSTPVITIKESDQAALRSIQLWKQGDVNDLIDRLIDSNRSEQIESFADMFEGNELCRLLSDVTKEVSRQPVRDWTHGTYAPGLLAIAVMMRHRQPDSQVFTETLDYLIQESVPASLPVVHTIMYFFASEGGQSRLSLLKPEQEEMLEQSLHAALCSSFPPGQGRELLDALKDGSSCLLHWLCWNPYRSGKKMQRSEPFEGWKGFSEVMLEAAELDSSIGLVQLVPFITSASQERVVVDQRKGPETQRDARFEVEWAKQLFDFDRLVRLLAKVSISDKLEDGLRTMWETARRAARELIKGNSNDPIG